MKSLLKETKNLTADLAFVKSYTSCLESGITKLEKRGMSLYEQMQVVNAVLEKINRIPGQRGEVLQEKMNSVLSKNTGYQELQNICNFLVHGEGDSCNSLSPGDISAYAYAPIVSVDVERSFSYLKNILSDKRHSFTENNLEKHIIISYNSTLLK